MRYLALACDYDGTLAHDGRVDEAALAGLERLLASGRRLILVSGRQLEELQSVFPSLHLFERVVVENGAVLYRPSSREIKILAEPPPPTFIQALVDRQVAPVSVGRVIVATWQPHEAAVLDAIRALGLELQVIFNKGAVMVLPAGVNKATGLAVALEELELSPHNAVGVGDAENDHAFLTFCECSAAVANALPGLKDKADVVLTGDHGAGVVELIDRLLRDDLRDLDDRLARHHLLMGTADGGAEVRVRPYGSNLLLVGPSGAGKSTLAAGLLERLVEAQYQFCVIDPEGDHEVFMGAVTLGTAQHSPGIEEVMQIIQDPRQSVIVNLVGLALADRPPFFLALLPRLQELRARTGRPHWLVVDETHHLLPSAWEPAAQAMPHVLESMVRITVDPRLLARPALESVETVVAVGDRPAEILTVFSEILEVKPPEQLPETLKPGEALVWSRHNGPPFRIQVAPSHTQRRRHVRKYAEGELPPDRSFYFQGPEKKLNLRAQNLMLFVQLADGVDDATWLHHLGRGEYSRWFREAIKDDTLAAEAAAVEERADLAPAESRRLIRAAIEERYTLPSSPPMPMPGTDAGQ